MYEFKQIKASKYVSKIFSINFIGFERSTFECIYNNIQYLIIIIIIYNICIAPYNTIL